MGFCKLYVPPRCWQEFAFTIAEQIRGIITIHVENIACTDASFQGDDAYLLGRAQESGAVAPRLEGGRGQRGNRVDHVEKCKSTSSLLDQGLGPGGDHLGKQQVGGKDQNAFAYF